MTKSTGLCDSRIHLKSLEANHLSTIHDWKNDFLLASLVMAQPLPVTYSNVEVWWSNNYNDSQQILFGIFLNSESKDEIEANLPVGIIRLMFIDWISRTGDLGIFIGDPSLRKKGIGKAAIKLILNYAFKNLNLHKICLRVLSSNKGAIHCYQSLGFHTEGTQYEQFWTEGKYENVVHMGLIARNYFNQFSESS